MDDRRRILAFRLARQGLSDARDGDPERGLRTWAVQDSPPGAAAAALAARGPVPAGWLDDALASRRAVALYNARTATAMVPAQDAAAYATGQLPPDDAGLRGIVGPALPGRRSGFAAPVEEAVAAISDALDGVVRSRDELHEDLRARLDPELLPWCPGCASHHARRGLLVMAALRGRLCLAGRAGRQPAFARTDQWLGGWPAPERAAAGAAFVRAYLRSYAPSTPADFARWAGLAPAHARALWASVEGELAPAGAAGGPQVLAEDAAALAAPPAPQGVRLLGPGDPLLQARDRDVLAPDRALHARIWRATGGPGVVVAGGELVALWRGRKRGTRLAVELEPVGAVAPPADAILAEAERLAPHRGCAGAELVA